LKKDIKEQELPIKEKKKKRGRPKLKGIRPGTRRVSIKVRMMIEEILKGKSQKDAYMIAFGIPPEKHMYASIRSSQLLKLPHVQKYMEQRLKEIREQTIVDIGRIMQVLSYIINFDIRRLFDALGKEQNIADLDSEVTLALKSVTHTITTETTKDGKEIIREKYHFEGFNKIDAARDVAKLLGAYKENIQIHQDGTVEHKHTGLPQGGFIVLPEIKNMDDWSKLQKQAEIYQNKQKQLLGFDKKDDADEGEEFVEGEFEVIEEES